MLWLALQGEVCHSGIHGAVFQSPGCLLVKVSIVLYLDLIVFYLGKVTEWLGVRMAAYVRYYRSGLCLCLSQRA